MPAETEDADSDIAQRTTPDDVIAAERDYLHRSRDLLGLMRENVLQLAENPMAGDPVSLEYLKRDLYIRAEALKDLPDAPLFFGRLDYSELAQADEDFAGADFHIGRRHVHDTEGTPVVLDWRAPVSRPFYRASPADPMGLTLRRRFGFAGGSLTAFEDERFTKGGAALPAAPSRLLISEIERPRSGPMRDIVATIQPEQDDIVRSDAATTVCVQGAPGTGKTAVGLHRIAYLLYAFKDQVTRRGVMVVGPNLAFLSYIRNVLPALGELDVTQTTVTGLVASVPVRGTDTDAAATIKGDARMAEVLRRALWAAVRPPVEALMVSRGSRRLRLPVHEIEALADELRRRGVRYGTGRELLAHRIAHVLLSQLEAAGETTDDRTHDAVRRLPVVRKCVDEVWPKADPKKLVFALLSSQDQLVRNGTGLLTDAEIALIAWPKPPRGPGSAPWSRADQVLLDEAADLIERTPSIAHIVVDEAQDLSPMEIRAIGRRCATGAATVLGDIAQGTTPWAATSWPSLLAHLGKPEAAVSELDVGYRVPRQILDFASRLLPAIAPRPGPGPVAARGRRRAAGGAGGGGGPGQAGGRRVRRPADPAGLGRRHLRRPAGGRGPRGPAVGRPGLRRARRDGARERHARVRHARGACDRHARGRTAHPGAGHAGQGSRVRLGCAGRAGPDRNWGGIRAPPAVRGSHPGRVPADRISRRTASGRAFLTYYVGQATLIWPVPAC